MSHFNVFSEEDMERLLLYVKEIWSQKGRRTVEVSVFDPVMAKIIVKNMKKECVEYQLSGRVVEDPDLIELIFIHEKAEGDSI
jgi:hypothetical protein